MNKIHIYSIPIEEYLALPHSADTKKYLQERLEKFLDDNIKGKIIVFDIRSRHFDIPVEIFIIEYITK